MPSGTNHKTILNVYFLLIDINEADLPGTYLSPQRKIYYLVWGFIYPSLVLEIAQEMCILCSYLLS